MKQLHVKSHFKALYGGYQDYGVIDGLGESVSPLLSSGIPAPIAFTAQNLSFLCPQSTNRIAMTVDVYKNNVLTSLGIVAAADDTSIIKNITDTVSFSVGDVIRFDVNGAHATFNNAAPWSVSIETEAAENIYGIAAFAGGLTAGSAKYGGAFGNGIYQSYGGSITQRSNTYSLAALDGNITHLSAIAFNGNASGTYTSYIILNGVLQDGSGGTVDTSVVLTGGTTFNVSSFTLPIAIQDVVDIITFRSGSDAPFVYPQVATSIAFTPTISDGYMFCGGSNSTFSGSATGWRWCECDQSPTSEDRAGAVVGVGGIEVKGMYIEVGVAAGTSPKEVDFTLRRSFSSTSLVVPITGSSTFDGSVIGDEVFPEDSIIDIQIDPISSPATRSFHWGIPVFPITPPPGNGTIIVQKVTVPSTSEQEFDFTGGGGLDPSSFSLQNGETQSFDVAPGTYSVSEDAVDNWDTVITVSNGDDPDTITVGSGDVITVTFTNTIQVMPRSGIYKIVPNKRNDTLWIDAGAGTTENVKIP